MEPNKEIDRLKMRMKLSKTLREGNLSTSTLKKITAPLRHMTDEQAEEEASRILTILSSCKNESDVLTKLSIQ